VLLVCAIAALGAAVRIADGNYHPVAGCLLAMVVAACVVVVPMRVVALGPRGWLVVGCAAGAGIGVEWVSLVARPLLPMGGEITSPAAVYAALCGCLVGTLLSLPALLRGGITARRWSRVGTALLLICHLGVGVATVRAAVSPQTDVVTFQQLAVAELLEGKDPYAMTFEDASEGRSTHYGPGLQENNRLLFGFPYPPLSLYWIYPATFLTEEFRYAHAVAFTLAGALIAFAGRSPLGPLAAGLFLMTPAGPYVIANGWTEPLVVLMLALTVFLASRRPRWAGSGLGLFWAAKQYVPLTGPLALLLVKRPVRRADLARLLISAVATAAVVTLPLVLWDAPAFWHSAVAVQFLQPFRPDALSLAAMIYDATGATPPAWVAFVALAAVQALALWRAPRTPAGFAVATGASLLAFFAFNKQAFANYYFLVIGALACGLAAAGESGPAKVAAASS
jgi:hypothetical protein